MPRSPSDWILRDHPDGVGRVQEWQNLNQGGGSQGSELLTLAQQGTISIGLNASTNTTNLGNGKSVTGSATVNRGNGSTTEIDSVSDPGLLGLGVLGATVPRAV